MFSQKLKIIKLFYQLNLKIIAEALIVFSLTDLLLCIVSYLLVALLN